MIEEPINPRNVWITWTEPLEETFRRPDGDVRWCFECRARRQFVYIVMSPIQPDDPEDWSYYGPSASIRCETCDTTDSDLFPGTSREWE